MLKPMTNAQLVSEPWTVTPLSIKCLNTPLSSPKQLIAVPSSPPKSELRATLELHVLTLGVLAHVQAGRSAGASKRIARLHTILDSGVLDRSGIRDGVVEVCDYMADKQRDIDDEAHPACSQVSLEASGSGHAPLFIHTTHPRVFFHLAFLVSAVAMRDATGRRPKPKVFATEGLTVCERERPKPDQRATGRCKLVSLALIF